MFVAIVSGLAVSDSSLTPSAHWLTKSLPFHFLNTSLIYLLHFLGSGQLPSPNLLYKPLTLFFLLPLLPSLNPLSSLQTKFIWKTQISPSYSLDWNLSHTARCSQHIIHIPEHGSQGLVFGPPLISSVTAAHYFSPSILWPCRVACHFLYGPCSVWKPYSSSLLCPCFLICLSSSMRFPIDNTKREHFLIFLVYVRFPFFNS